jgi:hypothetical protein
MMGFRVGSSSTKGTAHVFDAKDSTRLTPWVFTCFAIGMPEVFPQAAKAIRAQTANQAGRKECLFMGSPILMDGILIYLTFFVKLYFASFRTPPPHPDHSRQLPPPHSDASL